MIFDLLLCALGLAVAFCLVAGVQRPQAIGFPLRWAYAIGSAAGLIALILPVEDASWFDRAKSAPVTWALAFAAGALFERRRREARRDKPLETPEVETAGPEVSRFPKRAV